MSDSWVAFDLFSEPYAIPVSKKGKLLTVGDSFFNEFEDSVYLGIINTEGDEVLVHFLVSEKDEKRRAMYRGFIYGYFAEEKAGEL